MRLLRRLLLAAGCCLLLAAAGPCEGAVVVLLPLVNHTEAQEAGPVYWQQAVAKVKELGWELAPEGPAQEAAIDAMARQGGLLSGPELGELAAASKADLVLAMELDRWQDKIKKGSQVRYKLLDIRGKTAVYRQGKASLHGFGSNKQIEAAFTSRWDVKLEEWGRLVSREVERALAASK